MIALGYSLLELHLPSLNLFFKQHQLLLLTTLQLIPILLHLHDLLCQLHFLLLRLGYHFGLDRNFHTQALLALSQHLFILLLDRLDLGAVVSIGFLLVGGRVPSELLERVLEALLILGELLLRILSLSLQEIEFPLPKGLVLIS